MQRRVNNMKGRVIDVEGRVCISLVEPDDGENRQPQQD